VIKIKRINSKIQNYKIKPLNSKLLKAIDKTWTLFIDRDGVVNEEKQEDYIHNWDEFKFIKGSKESFRIFNEKFGTIIMVSNQRGVAKGVTNIEDVHLIHKNMLQEIEKAGGRIDKIYFCPDMHGPNRKPNPGMGLQALKDFKHIDLKKSLMVGNTFSDMEFGRNLQVALNIYIGNDVSISIAKKHLVDLVFPDLEAFSKSL
jgi:histidinol-phosphate phosphatase family protein